MTLEEQEQEIKRLKDAIAIKQAKNRILKAKRDSLRDKVAELQKVKQTLEEELAFLESLNGATDLPIRGRSDPDNT